MSDPNGGYALQPDTVYYARLQGVGPDGTLYRSEEFTFRTLPAGAGGGGAVNLASPQVGARVVGVSSNYGSGSDDSSYGALKAVDGNPSTQWSSDGEGDEAWEVVTSSDGNTGAVELEIYGESR